MTNIHQLEADRPDFISKRDMRFIRRDAKLCVKQTGMKLNQAYEVIALKNGFANWHQLIKQRNKNAEVESFLESHAVLVFDSKDAPTHHEISSELLSRDDWLEFAAFRELVFGFINKHHLFGDYEKIPTNWNEEDEPLKSKVNFACDCLMSLTWFRVNQEIGIKDTPSDVLQRIKSQTFFPPQYIIMRGIAYGVHDENEVFAW